MQVTLKPSRIRGVIAAPPSKSMAHRAVLCAALAGGKSRIDNLEFSQDVQATLNAARAMGCTLTTEPDAVELTAPAGFSTLTAPVDCGESGSTLRFLIPILSLTGQKVRLLGRGRLLQRPQQVYADLLPAHGCQFTQDETGITIAGALQPGRYELTGSVSSQFISGLLFALPLLDGDSTLVITPPFESRSYVELTRAMQAAFGILSFWQGPYTLYIPGNQRYRPCDYTVEGDYSNAAFAAVLGAAAGDVGITGLRADSLQGDAVILQLLQDAGAAFATQIDRVRFAKRALRGSQIDLADCPDLGPILMVLGALADGETVIRNAGRLRLKESDRIEAMETELKKFGVDITSTADTVTVRGKGGLVKQPETLLQGHNDHRVAMSLAVLALAAGVPVRIDGAECVKKSWPTFWNELARLGAEVTVHA